MTPQPTGRPAGSDLILTRRFAAPPKDIWASITEPGEYYLDLLAASRDGDPSTVRFGDYYPAQKAYHEGLEAG